MRVVRTGEELRAVLEPERRAGRTIGFVPTMGALHEGHLALLRSARQADEVVVLSIFVNPLQFGPNEDFQAYPRDEEGDLELAEGEGVDVAFVPGVEQMYPPGASTTVDPGPIGELYEGAERPGHFRGVCTVVTKLLNLVQPSRAYFGQKDAQQVAVIKRMVADLDFPVELVVCPTVREHDGLALSSRNRYLSAAERTQATVLYRALVAGRAVLEQGGDPAMAENEMAGLLASVPGVRPGYAVAVDPDSFGPPVPGRPVLLAVAARVGRARLIDNLVVG